MGNEMFNSYFSGLILVRSNNKIFIYLPTFNSKYKNARNCYKLNWHVVNYNECVKKPATKLFIGP